MSPDIKAVVAELERLEREASQTTSHVDACFADRDWDETALQAVPALLAELRRLWAKEARQQAIEEAAVSLREADAAYEAVASSKEPLDDDELRKFMAYTDAVYAANAALFAALEAKPTKEEP